MTGQTTLTRAALEEIVRRFAPRDRAAVPLTDDARLINDLGIDSPRMIDIVLEVEDRFHIVIDDAAMQRVRTFGEMRALVAQLTGAED
jgi:acyl carrier protein